MIDLEQYEVWFVTGSQQLYGEEVLRRVAGDSREIAAALDAAAPVAVRVVCKPVLTTPEAIRQLCLEATATGRCIGMVAWMHTFSPARMWIAGLKALQKPLCHLHTQFNRDIPWSTIDMEFMNLNQSAHGDREFGFICARMRRERKVIVGHWREPEVAGELAVWTRAAAAWADKAGSPGSATTCAVVTEGDKVEAQLRLGCVNSYPVGDLAVSIHSVAEAEIDRAVGGHDEATGGPRTRPAGNRRAETPRPPGWAGPAGVSQQGGFKGFTDVRESARMRNARIADGGLRFRRQDWKTAVLVP